MRIGRITGWRGGRHHSAAAASAATREVSPAGGAEQPVVRASDNVRRDTPEDGDRCARLGTVHHVAQEPVEHQQRPDRRAVVAQPRLVLVDEALEVRRVEEPGRGEALAEQALAHARGERAAEPARERHREAHLRAVHHVVRQMRLHRLLEQVLALLAAHLQRRRQPASHSTSG